MDLAARIRTVLIMILLLLPVAARSQSYSGVATSISGRPLPSATVTVCSGQSDVLVQNPQQSCNGQAALNPPSAPTLTAVTDAAPVAGTYKVVSTYLNSVGETIGSVSSSITTSGGSLGIQVTSPAAYSNATRWNAYLTVAGGTIFYLQNSSPIAIGTNYTQNVAVNTAAVNPPVSTTATAAILPLATIYSNVEQTVTLANPFNADGNGRYTLFAPAGSYTASISSPGYVTYSAPFIVPASLSGNIVLTGQFTAANPCSIDGLLWLSTGGCYTTSAACLAAENAAGGACVWPPNWSETLTANLTFTHSFTGFIAMGPMTLILGNFQITKAGGVNGVFITGLGGNYQNIGLVYTGSTDAIQMGDSSTLTRGLVLRNIYVDLHLAGSSAVGYYLTQIINFEIPSPQCLSPNTANSQVCMVLDGTGSFIGDGTITEPQFYGPPLTGIKFTGTSGGQAANNVKVLGGSFPNGCAAGGIGFNFVQGAGNIIIGADVEGCPTGVAFGNSTAVNGNVVSIWNATNTTDVSFGAASYNNVVTALVTAPIVTQAGIGNRVLWQGNNYNLPSSAVTASISPTTMTTPNTATTYRFSAYVTITAIGSSCGAAASTLVLNVIYTDPNGAGTTTTALMTINLAVTGNGALGAPPAGATEFPAAYFQAKSGTAVQYSTTYTPQAACSPGPRYQVYPVLEQVN